jgi:hypothetical protein
MSDESDPIYSVGGYRNAPGVSASPAGQTPSQPPGLTLPSGVVAVNTVDLKNAANGFDDLGGRISGLYAGLTATLNGNDSGGVPWGNDTLGRSFGEQYLPAAQTTLQALEGLAQLFVGIGSTLDDAVNSFRHASDYSTQLANQLS